MATIPPLTYTYDNITLTFANGEHIQFTDTLLDNGNTKEGILHYEVPPENIWYITYGENIENNHIYITQDILRSGMVKLVKIQQPVSGGSRRKTKRRKYSRSIRKFRKK
jgi:hypothetical protein